MSLTSVKVIKHSLAPCGKELISLECKFPRFILAEVNTHRVLSRNSASSRAIPVEKQIQRVFDEPFIPDKFTSNKPGMQGGAVLIGQAHIDAVNSWLIGRDEAVHRAKSLLALNIHKQYANRLIEPFQYHTALLSGTEWANMMAQRCHPDAQPEFQELAECMYYAITMSIPRYLNYGEWHLPYIENCDWDVALEMSSHTGEDAQEILKRVSVARCARVSYMNMNGKRELEADLKLWDKLLTGNHWSPFEHVAMALSTVTQSGNFVGFQQLRKTFSMKENVIAFKDINDNPKFLGRS